MAATRLHHGGQYRNHLSLQRHFRGVDVKRLYSPSALVAGLVLGFDGLRMTAAEGVILIAGLGVLIGSTIVVGASAYALATGQEPKVGDRAAWLIVGAAVLAVVGTLPPML